MSDNGEHYGGRNNVKQFTYGPYYYGSLPNDEEPEGPLPSINYDDIAYDEWSIKLSLKAIGLHEQYWRIDLCRRKKALERRGRNDEKIFDTLLYRMVRSIKLHNDYDRMILNLFRGFLRGIFEAGGMISKCTPQLMKDVSTVGGHFIAAPFYHYKVITLDEWGYFREGEDPETGSENEECQ